VVCRCEFDGWKCVCDEYGYDNVDEYVCENLMCMKCCNIREISDMLPSYLNKLNILIPNKTSI
jgi:hypothetical protein